MADTKILEAKINQTLVLKKIRNQPGISRIEIARELGLNRSTITYIVSGLLNKRLLVEGEALRGTLSQGGRTPIGLMLNSLNSLIIGVEWQIDYFRYVITDVSGKIIEKGRETLISKDKRDFYKKLSMVINKNQEKLAIPVRAVSLGVPGRVNPFEGTVLQSLPIGLERYPLADEMEKEFSLPVLIDNDANCFAWGELQETSGDVRSLLCLMLEFHFLEDGNFDDQEIGIGIVQNQKVSYGAHYSAGELENELVATGLKKEHLEYLRQTGDMSGESVSIVTDYFFTLFTALKPIVSVLDPGTVILGGDFLIFRDYVDKALQGVYENQRSSLGKSEIDWKYSSLGEYEVAFGAACHLMETIFTLPSYEMKNKERLLNWETILI
ncbi:MAG: ROK family transcriptional regulator [Bacteroidetes bacterium]|nr:ROK family transcriptional regulator [Bacteroidota bacterium]